jgi:hypothetical protein
MPHLLIACILCFQKVASSSEKLERRLELPGPPPIFGGVMMGRCARRLAGVVVVAGRQG